MRNIQKLMALHEDASVAIRHISKNEIVIEIESTFKDNWRKGEAFSSDTKMSIVEGSLLEAIETAANLAVERLEGCTCITPGLEDGSTTCWKHHDCRDGSCTHGE